jgi:hypothetical protein
MDVTYSNGDAALTGVLFLIISLVVTWLIIYSAVRAAVGHALDRTKPRFVVEATTNSEGVKFAVTNVGSAPAVDLTARWLEKPVDEPLARVPLLGVNARFEWTVAAVALPGETQTVRSLKLQWTRDPDLGSASVTCVVLVPSRLNAAG